MLHQKNFQFDFQVPLFPGTYVDELLIDVHVEDIHSGVLEFSSEDVQGIKKISGDTVSRSLVQPYDVSYSGSNIPSDSSFPALLKAYYRPGPLPDSGIMLVDGGECFTHLFNPSNFLATAGSMARRIIS